MLTRGTEGTPWRRVRQAALLRGSLLPSMLPEESPHGAVLIHRPPESGTLHGEREATLIAVPLLSRPRAPVPEWLGLCWPTLPAPLADGFVGY